MREGGRQAGREAGRAEGLEGGKEGRFCDGTNACRLLCETRADHPAACYQLDGLCHLLLLLKNGTIGGKKTGGMFYWFLPGPSWQCRQNQIDAPPPQKAASTPPGPEQGQGDRQPVVRGLGRARTASAWRVLRSHSGDLEVTGAIPRWCRPQPPTTDTPFRPPCDRRAPTAPRNHAGGVASGC